MRAGTTQQAQHRENSAAMRGSGQSTANNAPEEVEQALARIRELNERILEQGRDCGLDLLDAYEMTLTTFADQQTRAADAAGPGMPHRYALPSVKEILPRPKRSDPPPLRRAGDVRQRELVAASLLLCPEAKRPDAPADR
jgi:hypothetical protein